MCFRELSPINSHSVIQGNMIGETGLSQVGFLRGRGGGLLSVVNSLGLELKKTSLCSSEPQTVLQGGLKHSPATLNQQ